MAMRIGQIVLIAVAYGLAGRLGQLLAVPPSYATAVWPASGIALAALLLYGYRVCPGIFIGAMVVNAWSPVVEAQDSAELIGILLRTGSISIGVTMQAVLAKLLVKRTIGLDNSLTRERDILAFLAFGGPVACLVGATWGVSTLYLSGFVKASEMAINWWTWWVGDVIGVIIFAPLMLMFFARPRAVWQVRRLTVALPMAVAFIVATVGYVYAQVSERSRVQLAFERRVDHVFEDITEQLVRNLDAVHSLKSYYQASEDVQRKEFTEFNRELMSRHVGVQALEWLPRVPHEERAAYEALARQEGIRDFEIRERTEEGNLIPARNRPEYFPVFFVEPSVTNEAAIGYDVASNPERRTAMGLARDTGGPVATSPVRLVQETADQAGFLVFDPIFASGAPTSTADEREDALLGYVLGVYRVGDIVHAALRSQSQEDYTIQAIDVAPNGVESNIYASGEQPTPHKAREVATLVSGKSDWQNSFDFAEREWRFTFRPTDRFFAKQTFRQTWLVLAAGLSFTGMLGAFLLILAGRAARVEELVDERTGELSKTNEDLALEIKFRQQFEDAFCLAHENLERRVQERTAALKASESRYLDLYDNAPDMFVSVDMATQRVTECNQTFLTVTGFDKDDVIDRHVFDLYHSDCLDAVRRSFKEFLGSGKTLDLELLLLRADGGVVDVSVNVSAIRDSDGNLLFSRAVLRDIRAKKQAEARIRNQEIELAHVARLSTMGEMATGLAHEINQPLAAIAAFAEGAAMRIRDDNVEVAKLLEVVDRISTDAHRAGEIVHRLRRFVHKRDPEFLPLDINEVVTDVVQFVASDVRRRGVTIGFNLDKDLPPLIADSIGIQQVLINLIRNGCDAMEHIPAENRNLVVQSRRTQDDTIEVEVGDCGPGLPDDMRDQVFEAFYTSKQDGLGMGLAISRSIIESHGGRIWATTNSEGGASFYFSLPVAEGALIDE